MSNCVKDFYDYESDKKCCSCESICLNSNFYRNVYKWME